MPTEQIVTRYIVDELLPGGGTASRAYLNFKPVESTNGVV